MTNKQMKRKKPINTDLMRTVEPLTDNQEDFFKSYKLDDEKFLKHIEKIWRYNFANI